jgi:hypothetical protein
LRHGCRCRWYWTTNPGGCGGVAGHDAGPSLPIRAKPRGRPLIVTATL